MTCSRQRVLFVSTLAVLVGLTGCGKDAPPEDAGVGALQKDAVKEDDASEPGPAAKTAEKGPRTPSGLPIVPVSDLFTLPAATPDYRDLALDDVQAFLDEPSNHEPLVPRGPLGLEPVEKYIPDDNPMTRAKIELGRQLYFDTRLSLDNSVACATCHEPTTGWAENKPVSTGIQAQQGTRNAPTVLNRVYGKSQFWDGRAASLEEQSLGPIENPIEMGFTLPELMERLEGIEGYRIQFEKIFGGVSPDAVAKAIATFERTVLAGASPFDYYERTRKYEGLAPEDFQYDPELAAQRDRDMREAAAHPMSDAARRGRELFFKKAACSLCHVGANLTDEAFYNIGVGMDTESPDPGRVSETGKPEDTGAFKVPSLRNVASTAPYMHDGSQKTLAEVVEFYDKGGRANPHLHKRIKKLNLTEAEKSDLVAFMEALSGPLPKIPVPRLP